MSGRDQTTLDRIDSTHSAMANMRVLAKSVSILMHRAIGDPDDDLATLVVCEVVLDHIADRLEQAEVDLHAVRYPTA